MNINEPVVHVPSATRYFKMPNKFGGVSNFAKAGDHSDWVQAPKLNGEYVASRYILEDAITVMGEVERDAVDAAQARSDYERLLREAGLFRYTLIPDHPTKDEALEFMPLGGKYLLTVNGITTQWGLRMGDGIATQESSHATDGSGDRANIDFNIETREERTDRKNHNSGKWSESKVTRSPKTRPNKVK